MGSEVTQAQIPVAIRVQMTCDSLARESPPVKPEMGRTGRGVLEDVQREGLGEWIMHREALWREQSQLHGPLFWQASPVSVCGSFGEEKLYN